MDTYHTLAARHQVEMVNHFIAVIDCDTIVAIYNDKTNTVQVYAAHAPLHTHRVVQFNKANDARCMFSHIPAAAATCPDCDNDLHLGTCPECWKTEQPKTAAALTYQQALDQLKINKRNRCSDLVRWDAGSGYRGEGYWSADRGRIITSVISPNGYQII